MNSGLLWITTAVLGAAGSLIVGVGGLVGMTFLVLALPLLVRGSRLVALSGLLTGFGAFWLFMMGRQFLSGGRLDNSSFWITLGVVPLAIGLALTVGVVSHQLQVRLAARG
jgi:hypothetical protein